MYPYLAPGYPHPRIPPSLMNCLPPLSATQKLSDHEWSPEGHIKYVRQLDECIGRDKI